MQTEIIGAICKIICSNKFPVSQFFSDVILEISHIIFYPDQSGSMYLAFPILHLIPLSLAIEFLFALVKRIGIYVMLNPVVFKC